MKDTIKKITLLIVVVAAFSCNTNKVYDSADAKKKKKINLTIGKYNRLLKSSDMEAKYAAAVKYFEKESYDKALGLFEELISIYRGTSKAEEIQYYYAYCHYNLGDYILAGYQFRTYVRIFPQSKHTEECAYMNAYCFYLSSPEYSLDQTDTKLAIREFQKFVNQYPKSERIKECNEILDIMRAKLERKSFENAMLYYSMSDYKASIVAFGNHVKDFPDSKRIEEAHYLIIKSHYLLALNSIDAKKTERFNAAINSYAKFAELFPKSSYLKLAESISESAQKQLKK